jgi:hypothetical protein
MCGVNLLRYALCYSTDGKPQEDDHVPHFYEGEKKLLVIATHFGQVMQAILVSGPSNSSQEEIMNLMTVAANYLPSPVRENFLEAFHTLCVPGELGAIYYNRVVKPLKQARTC